ncbi:hypothetical protein TNCV_334611 [Trichonephila clavipes]|nr:hypothetical protein TNCV_334611 [Trichonephila clavipes]
MTFGDGFRNFEPWSTQVELMTPQLALPLLTTTTNQWNDVCALDRFNLQRAPSARRVVFGTWFEFMKRQS